MDILELNYLDIDENDSYKEIIKKVLKKCFEIATNSYRKVKPKEEVAEKKDRWGIKK